MYNFGLAKVLKETKFIEKRIDEAVCLPVQYIFLRMTLEKKKAASEMDLKQI